MELVRVSPGEPAFEEASSDLRCSFRMRRVVAFLGAGISAPSGLPLSIHLRTSLIDAMTAALRSTRLAPADETELQDLRATLLRLPLERLLDGLSSLHGDESVIEFLEVLDGASPNYNHLAVAELAQRGHLGTVVTLNFDVLIERALHLRSVPFAWNLPLAGAQVGGAIPGGVRVVKPHGTLPFPGLAYAPHYLAATLKYAGDRPQPETEQVLRAIAAEHPVLLVAGYRDDDWDIFPILSAQLWERVYWCQHVDRAALLDAGTAQPCEKVRSWMASRPAGSSAVLAGDARTLFSAVIGDSRQAEDWSDVPRIAANPEVFNRRPARTALAALLLTDGVDNGLFRRLLPQVEGHPALQSDLRLQRTWRRAMSWYYHAQVGNVRLGIESRQELLRSGDRAADEEVEHLGDLKTLYYGYLSAAKRLHANWRWPLDLLLALRIRMEIERRVNVVRMRPEVDPWTRKEAERQLALVEYYRVDLLHNWGYYLIPFTGGWLKPLRSRWFRGIARRYRDLARRFPVLDWEYHFVRLVEAELIGDHGVAGPEVAARLASIASVFDNTGAFGHLAYLKAVQAILDRSEEGFAAAERPFLEPRGIATPAGKLRMRILRRCFWPSTISLAELLREMREYASKRAT